MKSLLALTLAAVLPAHKTAMLQAQPPHRAVTKWPAGYTLQ